ncbi:MAG: arginine--tRNA ligase [Treponema sp.]|jgi:arginyl-tRNA synthetase|nr:arginine--tRNA ligase [Treponema sp.]
MFDLKEIWTSRIAAALNSLLEEAGSPERIEAARVTAELPPRPEMGDLGFPMFAYAKLLRKGPPQIAALVAEKTLRDVSAASGAVSAEGPYVNVRCDRAAAARAILAEAPEDAAGPLPLRGRRIMVEFSSPNTNKPLHLGHLRNDILGESISRILAARGADVRKVCIINDRGIHICKSMLAYQRLGGGRTPESEGRKSDHFVGDWYVAFNKMARDEKAARGAGEKTPSGAEESAQELLRKWEAGDSETVELWKKMNGWTVDGMKATYERTGVSFDQYYFESGTYLKGREEILKGLEKGLFYRADDGSVWVDLEEEKLGKKVLLRKDGTSLYITQDIGTAIYRHNDWPFDTLVFVVGSEQQYHFRVLFTILEKLAFPWAKNLCHLSYGMVNLPEGKMKSREGTVVDADDLLDKLHQMALEEIREKEREAEVGDPDEVAEKVALGALHYYLLSVTAAKDMLFDPKESLSFNGNTGPYLQYMGARISSMLRKAGADGASPPPKDFPPPDDTEWELVKTIALYNEVLNDAARVMDPSVLAAYLYNLSRAFSRFYHDCPILAAPTNELRSARLLLSKAVLRILKDAMRMLCIPFLEIM